MTTATIDAVYRYRDEHSCHWCRSCIRVKRVVSNVRLETRPRSYLYTLELECKAGHTKNVEFQFMRDPGVEKLSGSVLAEFDPETKWGY